MQADSVAYAQENQCNIIESFTITFIVINNIIYYLFFNNIRLQQKKLIIYTI
jgi:hypothetical protein